MDHFESKKVYLHNNFENGSFEMQNIHLRNTFKMLNFRKYFWIWKYKIILHKR